MLNDVTSDWFALYSATSMYGVVPGLLFCVRRRGSARLTTGIHLRLLPAESAFTAANCIRALIAARDMPAILLT